MEQEHIILQMVNEIRTDQKMIITDINKLMVEQANIKNDIINSRNGYTTDEIVDMFHYVEKMMKKSDNTKNSIRTAIINYAVPLLCGGILLMFLRYFGI